MPETGASWLRSRGPQARRARARPRKGPRGAEPKGTTPLLPADGWTCAGMSPRQDALTSEESDALRIAENVPSWARENLTTHR